MAEHKETNRNRINRRELLRKAGQVALAPVALLAAGEAEAASPIPRPGPGGLVTVFRLRPCPPGEGVHQACSCNACVQHAKHKYFASKGAADRLRAHRHCNCHIVQEQIPVRQFIAMFRPGTPSAREVFDLRW